MKATDADRLTSTETDMQIVKPPAGVALPTDQANQGGTWEMTGHRSP